MNVLTEKRIVLLGKTGAGKSSLANVIFGEELFTINSAFNSGTGQCQSETKSVNGRNITLIGTPGFFDTDRSEKDLKPEIERCITECAPGPHAFLIVLKVERYTQHEQAVITKICQYFSEDALKYAVVVFTHGNQLPEGMQIQEFVHHNKNMSNLLKKCGGRCHVVDNKYWKDNKEDDYRNNQFQVAELLNTLDKMTEANQGKCYTNEMLQAVQREIQREEECIRQSPGNMSLEEIRNNAKMSVYNMIRSAGCATGALLGALLGVAEMVTHFQNLSQMLEAIKERPMVVPAALSAVKGGEIGYNAAEGAETLVEAVQKAAKAVWSHSGFSADQNNK